METRAVMVTTTKVSTKTAMIATTPCSWGVFHVGHSMCMRVDPMPASLENRPRLAPWGESGNDAEGHAADGSLGLKAHSKISAKAAGS